jgi:hypothetical protein
MATGNRIEVRALVILRVSFPEKIEGKEEGDLP